MKRIEEEHNKREAEAKKDLHGILGLYVKEAQAKAEGKPLDPETAELLRKVRSDPTRKQ